MVVPSLKIRQHLSPWYNEKKSVAEIFIIIFQADEAVRQRTYQSMDLFLQGVQTQLRSLINNSDIPPSS